MFLKFIRKLTVNMINIIENNSDDCNTISNLSYKLLGTYDQFHRT